MKAYKRIIGLSLALSLVSLTSCRYNEFSRPEMSQPETNLKANINVRELTSMCPSSGSYTIFKPIILKAQVVSDDYSGNFYKRMTIQDATGGIDLKLDMANMSALYKRGQWIYILCQDMTLGTYGGTVSLGYKSVNPNYSNGYLPERLIPYHIIASVEGKVEPKEVTISNLNQSEDNNTFVEFKDLQFVDYEFDGKPLTWADPENKVTTPVVERTLIDKSGNKIVVRTSGYAKFAGQALPSGSGTVRAIVSYFNGTPQLTICSLDDIQMSGPRF